MNLDFLNRIGIGSKLAVIGALALTVTAYGVNSIYQLHRDSIISSQQELVGLKDLALNAKLLHETMTLRAEARSYLADPSMSPDGVNNQRQLVNQAMQQLRSSAEAVDGLNSDSALGAIANSMDALLQKILARQIAIDEAANGFSVVNNDIIGFGKNIGDITGTSLDPDQDTYFLQYLADTALPAQIQATADLRGEGRLLLGKEPVTPQLTTEFQSSTLQFQVASSDSKRAYARLSDRARNLLLAGGNVEPDKVASTVNSLISQVPLNGAASSITAADFRKNMSDSFESQFKLIDSVLDAFNSGVEARIKHDQSAMYQTVGGMTLLTLLIASLGYLATRSITQPLNLAVKAAAAIARADFTDTQLRNGGSNEVSVLLNSLDDMRAQLATNVQTLQANVTESARIRAALDSVTTNVMIADHERTIVYANPAVIQMLRIAENDIRKVFPSFDPNHIIGQSIDQFHRNPHHQRHILESFKTTHRAEISLADRTFQLIANPVSNPAGERIGSVVQWLDRTAEVATEKEIAQIISAAAQGDFSGRLELSGKIGFFKPLAESINRLLDTTSAGLEEIATVLSHLSSGDLTYVVEKDYQGIFGELKNSANLTVDTLSGLLRKINEAASSINMATREIAQGNQNLSSRTEQQAANLEETAASMEELTGTVKMNAQNSQEATQLAQSANEIAQHGGQVVGSVITTMSAIHDSARKIVDIISVIDGIAFQTNILALNAAVEAARAGEQGRGFAVVASEVRNLAQRSATAAKEIKGLINNSVEKVESGSKQVHAAGDTMQQVVTSIQRVAQLMREISTASVEQSTGIEQVNHAIVEMDGNTQQNAALVEQAAAAAQSLNDQAFGLLSAINAFKVAGGVIQNSSAPRLAKPVTKHPVSAKPLANAPRPSGRALPPPAADGDEWDEF